MLIVRHGYPRVPGNNVTLYCQDSTLVEKHPGHLKRNRESSLMLNTTIYGLASIIIKLQFPIGTSLISRGSFIEISEFVHPRITLSINRQTVFYIISIVRCSSM